MNNTPTEPNPGAPGEMSDAEVNAALAFHLGKPTTTQNVCPECGFQDESVPSWSGDNLIRRDGYGQAYCAKCKCDAVWEEVPDYCSPDAPHSLRVELVEAVKKAGKMDHLMDAIWVEWAADDEGKSMNTFYLTYPLERLARAALAALTAKGEAR